ncbi:hypothetical protein N7E02_28680 [Aliirhizobium terrae]|uniref:hypothetical protein n=1 Tax=Terrirhizobium terrae TaxID=2926709 RepID=UPI002577D6C9|nr:hypothetical protein [Rhizobium sp. CC-CFT758]WJH40453.1 hypothetical protein N7E02_28680 [Rhizobium sp. CC-CFT758]
MAQTCAELRAIGEVADRLVERVVSGVGPGAPHAADIADFDRNCDALIAHQKMAHAMLAGQVGEISKAVDGARTALAADDEPRRSDRWIGHVSKRLMRRRIAGRSGRLSQGQGLLLVLGRCDRLAGIIEGHRHMVTGQRDRAEATLSKFYSRNRNREQEMDDAAAELSRPSDIESAQAVDPAAPSFSAFVDLLNRAIGDHVVLLHKLTFDLEHALEVYNVLTDMGLVREALPGPEAHPHFSPSIARFADGILPGGRLAPARHAADRAFEERFSPRGQA